MDDQFDTPATLRSAPVVNPALLEHLLNVGGADLRPVLAQQICADFTRLAGAIQAVDGADVARAAHELKGLAATVGADTLAQMACALNAAAPTLGAGARQVRLRPVAAEIVAVVAFLRRVESGSAPR